MLILAIFSGATVPSGKGHAGCDLHRVGVDLYANAEIYSGNQWRFPDRVIDIPRKHWAELGIRQITKGKVLGTGAEGTVFQVTVELVDSKGNTVGTREMAWKEANGLGDRNREASGMQMQYEASGELPMEAKASGPILAVRKRISLVNNGMHGADGYLMDLGGQSLDGMTLRKPPGSQQGFCLWDSKGALVRDSRELLRRLRMLEILKRQMSEALRVLREKGIVHHDLKPANVMIYGGKFNTVEELLTGHARLVLTDFFQAKRVTNPHNGMGAPAYMAPEVRSGAPPASPQDVYGLAVMIAEGLTGRRLRSHVEGPIHPEFTPKGFGRFMADLRAQLGEQLPPEGDRILRGLEIFVEQGLDLNPKNRPVP